MIERVGVVTGALTETDIAGIHARSEETIGSGIGWYGRYHDSEEGICFDESRLNEEQLAWLRVVQKGRIAIIYLNDDGEITDFNFGSAMPSLIQ